MIRQTGADGAVFARAALGNPWIFRQFRDFLAGRPVTAPSLAEQREVLERHYADVVALYGPRRGSAMMRRFGVKYSRLHPAPARVRAAFVAVGDPNDWRGVMENFYASG